MMAFQSRSKASNISCSECRVSGGRKDDVNERDADVHGRQNVRHFATRHSQQALAHILSQIFLITVIKLMCDRFSVCVAVSMYVVITQKFAVCMFTAAWILATAQVWCVKFCQRYDIGRSAEARP